MTRAERAARDAARAAAQFVGDTNRLQSFRILRFGRHKDGYFHAEVTTGDGKAYVHCKSGSWFMPREMGSRSGCEVVSPYRDILSEQMRSFERKEVRIRQQRKEETMASATTAEDAARLLRLIGYSDDEITAAIQEKFRVTHHKACGILQHVDKHLSQQEAAA